MTTEGSHPFSTGLDLCLVHNGSLSNHNRLRENLRREGIGSRPRTTPRSPPATSPGACARAPRSSRRSRAASTTWTASTRLPSGPPMASRCLRDPIACKPAVLAETDDWVAMSSEWRAIAVLPGAADARMWEPAPGSSTRGRRSRRGLMAVRAADATELEVVDLDVDSAARAQPAAARPRRRSPGPSTGVCSTRTAPTRSPAGSMPISRSRSTATSGTTARA